jgi:hypothetical protein
MNGTSHYHKGGSAKGSPVLVGLIRWASVVWIATFSFEAEQ